jgi:hypothetical protein
MDMLSRVLSLDTGFGLAIGFIGPLNLVTTNNYNRFTDLHTLQVTTTQSTLQQFIIARLFFAACTCLH